MNAISTPSDHTYANTQQSTSASIDANVSPSISFLMDNYDEDADADADADETLKADEFDEARNEANLVAVLLRKIFLNQSVYEEAYAEHMDRLESNEKEMKQQLTAQSAEIKELREKLAKSEDQLKQFRNQIDEEKINFLTKLNENREVSFDFYLVMNYVLEKFFSHFNEKSEYETSENLEPKVGDAAQFKVENGDVAGQQKHDEEEAGNNGQETIEEIDISTSSDDDSAAEDEENEVENQEDRQEVPEPIPPIPKCKRVIRIPKSSVGEGFAKRAAVPETVSRIPKSVVGEDSTKRAKHVEPRNQPKPKSTLRIIHPRPNVMRMFESKIKKVVGCKKCTKIESKPQLLVHLQEYHKMSPTLNRKLCYNDFTSSLRSIDNGNMSSVVKVTDRSTDPIETPAVRIIKANDSTPKPGKRYRHENNIESGPGGSGEKKKKRRKEEDGTVFRHVMNPRLRIRKTQR